jgi:6-phosphogluconolactonase (cycloisomerase 2 family)
VTSWSRWRRPALLGVAAAIWLCPGAAAQQPYGALMPLPGPMGCVARGDQGDGCAEGRGLHQVHSVVLSPDGRFLYSAAGSIGDPPNDDGAIGVFAVDPKTGGISQLPGKLGCAKNPRAVGGTEGCSVARNVEGMRFVNLSPDGRFLYTGSFFGMSIFRVDSATGALSQLPGPRGCFRSDGAENCTKAPFVRRTEDIRFTRDGRFAYTANIGFDSLVVFKRDPRAGNLTQLPAASGCVTSARAAGSEDHAGCAPARGLRTPRGVTLSPDERFLYLAAIDEAILIFRRNRVTGALSQLRGKAGCITPDGSQGCAIGRGIYGPHRVTLTADGRSAYVAGKRGSGRGSAISIWRRDPRTGVLRQLPGSAGCIAEFSPAVPPTPRDRDDRCAPGRVVLGAHVAVLDREERTLYVASDRPQGGVAIFRRDRTTGALTQLPGASGCIAPTADAGCTPGRRQNGLHYLVLSKDDRFAYAAGENAEAVIVYRRAGG